MIMKTDFADTLPDGFFWLKPPSSFSFDGGLHLTTDPNTDFWQRTHYGFRNDNGHALLTQLEGDFALQTHVRFQYENRFDQCGLLLRLDAKNWIKLSTELETPDLSMLGSVVTNLGYSDWATTELDYIPREMWYHISKQGADVLLQASPDGRSWRQLRIAHIHPTSTVIQAGIYACTPTDGRFTCTFTGLEISENLWFPGA